ncbi:CAP22 protein [Purpureocillium lavendulum]|uniref:CAP22 protein n=1 Tax=Purpureocillium lavendulum TaxID=1247861 RepID=A0AB34FC10_9HYPO|nr:CAP22 protein [Purpureocillium lavendulum]
MYPKTLAVALATLALVSRASVDFDMDDVPTSCKTICGPIDQLTDRCDTDLYSGVDRDEKLLEAQCVCINRSFDVAKIAALCADCMHESANGSRRRDNDDIRADQDALEDIDNIMSTITIAATAATDISQLTTTLAGGSQPAQISAGGSNGTTQPGVTKTTTMTSGSRTITSTGAAAATRAPVVAYVAGAAVAGGLML